MHLSSSSAAGVRFLTSAREGRGLTEAAVVSFQRRAGIKVDAMIGPDVIRRLEEHIPRPTNGRP
jgi:hypothetical protein